MVVMSKTYCIILIFLSLTDGCLLEADQPFRWGAQAGLNAPLPSDLRLTAGSGLNPALGLNVDWMLPGGQTLRSRLDLGFFSRATQAYAVPGLQQTLTTQVRNEALGEEYLYRPGSGPWSFGAGLYLIRWRVASTDSLVTPQGVFTASSTSSWTRQGLGLITDYRLDRHSDLELSVLSSHYGYENQPARVAALNFLWHF